MIVVSDTSPITNLIQIRQLFLLHALFGEVIIASAVYKELSEIAEQQTALSNLAWIRVQEPPENKLLQELKEKLDNGEAASIALAVELKADYLLIDELKGRDIAEELGLKVIGLLGILLKAKQIGLVKEVKVLLQQLKEDAGFFIHPALCQKIIILANEKPDS